MSDADIALNRRTVLKRASVGAAVGVLATTGSATATVSPEELRNLDTRDCECTNEYKCVEECCREFPHFYSDYTQYYRECCTCDGETVCEDIWTEGSCCLGPQ